MNSRFCLNVHYLLSTCKVPGIVLEHQCTSLLTRQRDPCPQGDIKSLLTGTSIKQIIIQIIISITEGKCQMLLKGAFREEMTGKPRIKIGIDELKDGEERLPEQPK